MAAEEKKKAEARARAAYRRKQRKFEENGLLEGFAPINWPCQPAEKPMTREAAQVLNRIAQLVAGDGAAEINYKGAVMSDVDARVESAVSR